MDMGTAATTMAMDMGTMAMDMDMGTTTTMAMDMGTATAMAMDMGTTTAMTMDMGTTTTMAMDMGTTTAMAMSMHMHSGANAASSMAMSMPMSMSMSMPSTGMKMSCKMSMLWNWYHKDVCFLSDQWKTSTPAIFAGTCIGVFALLSTIVWWRRLLFEYKSEVTLVRKEEVSALFKRNTQSFKTLEPSFNESNIQTGGYLMDVLLPLKDALKHKWLALWNDNLTVVVGDKVYIYPSPLEHILYCVGDTMEWSVHHVIMLLYMYFNGYVFISSMIGAGVGWLLFNYRQCGTTASSVAHRRCCL